MKKFNKKSIVTVLIVSLALGFIPLITAQAATAPGLGTSDSYAVFGAAGVTNTGLGLLTHIWGNVGADLLANITGLLDDQVDGTIIAPTPAQLLTDITAAYGVLAGQYPGTAINLAGPKTVTPGVYAVLAGQTLSGTITLDGAGVYIFGSDSSYAVANSAKVLLTNGATACNVFWQIPTAMTIGTSVEMVGTIITNSQAITLDTSATLQGRAFSRVAAVTLLSNQITTPSCAAVAPVSGTSRYGKINVVKTVINDNGGTKTVADFPLFVNGASVISGVTNDFAAPGSAYTITETSDSNYTQTFSGDCAGDGKVALNPGDNNFCIITNNDIGAPVVVPPVPPLIDVIKIPNPLSLPDGPGAVTYTYTLKNIGIVPVTDVTMVGDTCSPIVLVSGDTNADAKLDVNETWVHTCSATLSATHTNTVVATGWANGISATDIASATVVVGAPIVPPLIHLVKVPSVFSLPSPGGAVTYTYTVTNPGTAPLSSVSIADDECTGLPGRVLGHPGDINKNDLLESNEAWSFTCQSNLTQTTTNTGTVQGSANGLTTRDFAIATVVVSAADPKLPSAGLPPENKDTLWNVILLFGILVSTFVLIIFKKWTI